MEDSFGSLAAVIICQFNKEYQIMIVEIYLLFLTEQRGSHNLQPVWLRGNNLLSQNIANVACCY